MALAQSNSFVMKDSAAGYGMQAMAAWQPTASLCTAPAQNSNIPLQLCQYLTPRHNFSTTSPRLLTTPQTRSRSLKTLRWAEPGGTAQRSQSAEDPSCPVTAPRNTT
jgi:hypothetical protein